MEKRSRLGLDGRTELSKLRSENKKDGLVMKGTAIVREIDPDTGEELSRTESENIVVNEGAEYIRDLINPEGLSGSNMEWVLIGETTDIEGDESVTDDQLDEQKDEAKLGEPSGHIELEETTDGYAVWWRDFIFHQGAGKDNINELATADGDNSETDTILNRTIFEAVDNLNNDLLVSYQLEVLAG